MGKRKGESMILKTRFMVNDAYRLQTFRRPYICPYCGGRITYKRVRKIPVLDNDGNVLYYMLEYTATCTGGCVNGVKFQIKEVIGESSKERAFRLYTAMIEKIEGEE